MKRALILLAISVAPFAAPAQEPITSYVTATGEATVFAPPTHVTFHVKFSAALPEPAAEAEETPKEGTAEAPAPAAPEDPTNAAVVARLNQATSDLRKALNDLDLHPVEFEATVPTVRAANTREVACVARLRFSLSGFSSPDTGPAQFADLCDKLTLVAQRGGATLQGPAFEVEDKESLQRNAVTQATTNAFPIGDAIALALSSRIDYVETVKVAELKIDENDTEPNLKQLSCTAKVEVTYAVHAAQP